MELGAAMGAFSAVFDIAKTALEARDEGKINAALSELNRKHLDLSTAALQLQEKLVALQAALSELQSENTELRAKANDRAHYVLHAVSPGRFVYRNTPDPERPDIPAHYLCQTCYDQGIKSVLHVIHDNMVGTAFECLADKKHTFYT